MFALGGSLSAQPKIDFDGYIVNVPAFLRLNKTLSLLHNIDQNIWMDVTRLRLRPTLNLSENGYIALEYEADGTYNSGTMLMLVPPSVNRHQLFDLSWDLRNSDRWQFIHGIDRFYYRQQVGAFDISIGRQRIAWGSGRIWNPTDLFNPLNPTVFSKIEKDGVDAASVKLTLGTLTDATLVYNPQQKKTSNYGIRFRTNYKEYDIIGIAGYFDKRVIVGGDVAGNLFDAGIRSEIILSMKKEDASEYFLKGILGADYQWTAKLYTLVEYHYNGEGERNPAKYNLSKLSAGEMLNVGVNYLAVSASYLIHPLVTAIVTGIGNLDDKSAFLALSVAYLPTDEMSVTFGGQLFAGDQMDEYWYYPGSGYLKMEMFF
jgi:hypothetical protein